jgi:hypothetical protein
VGNQPFGWMAPPYTRVFPCQGYYFLDQDNPGTVTPFSFQLYHDNNVVHGQWETLLDFTNFADPPTGRYHYGLITGVAGPGVPLQLRLSVAVSMGLAPFGTLYADVPTLIPAYVYDWANTRAWTWQNIGQWVANFDFPMGGMSGELLWMPNSAHPAYDFGPAGILPFLRLRVEPPAPGGVNWACHRLDIAISGPRSPTAENWSIVLRQA